MKKLELGNILIHDVQFSNEGSKVENGVLYVNKEEICKIALEDEKHRFLRSFPRSSRRKRQNHPG